VSELVDAYRRRTGVDPVPWEWHGTVGGVSSVDGGWLGEHAPWLVAAYRASAARCERCGETDAQLLGSTVGGRRVGVRVCGGRIDDGCGHSVLILDESVDRA
jgi:hypothetical protein